MSAAADTLTRAAHAENRYPNTEPAAADAGRFMPAQHPKKADPAAAKSPDGCIKTGTAAGPAQAPAAGTHGVLGVFDSGLGGLTALRRLRALAPGCDIVYFGDTARVPYGTRDTQTLIRFAQQDVAFLQSQGAQRVLVACGTISSALPAQAWAQLPLPCQGVVHAAADAALAATRNGRIGVLATPVSIASGSYVRRLHAQRPEAEVVTAACPDFVPLIESGRAGSPAMRAAAEKYLTDIRAAGCDTVILGCTHYPLAAPLLQELLGDKVQLIDSGAEAARAMLQHPAPAGEGTLRCFVSGDAEVFARHAAALLGDSLQLPAVQQVQLA